jgi:predicted component of type VI protein secretion system
MGDEGTPKTEMINPALLDGVSANFIVKGPSGVEKSYPMRSITMGIGRSDQCEISVKDGSMSGRHAEVTKINGEIRVRDAGSANGVWLNGERITDAELFDGDVIRLGQTSIRVDVVGGKKRPDAGMNPKLIAAIVGGCVVVLIAVIALTIVLKKKAQHKQDLASVASFVATARDNQKAKPYSSVVDKMGDLAKQANGIPKASCSEMPKGDDAKKVVGGYRELGKTYDRIVTSLNDYSARSTAETTALASFTEQVVDPAIKAKLAEASEAIEARHQVTTAFIGDWKKLSQATNQYAVQADAVFNQGNKAMCPMVDKGVQAKSPVEIISTCKKNFDKQVAAVDEKLKELDDLSQGGTGEGEAKAE